MNKTQCLATGWLSLRSGKERTGLWVRMIFMELQVIHLAKYKLSINQLQGKKLLRKESNDDAPCL